MRKRLERALDRSVMDLRREAKRDAITPVVLGGHSKIATGVMVVFAVGPVLSIQQQRDLFERIAHADQRLLSVVEQERRGLDFVGRRRLDDRLELLRKLSGNLADSQAVDFESPTRLLG